MRRLALAAALFACLAFVAAGCGSSKPAATPTADWANSVCGALVTWTTAMKSVSSGLKSGKTLTKSGIADSVSTANTATKTLADSLKSLGKPDTASGQQAKDAVSQLADELSTDVDKISAAVKKASGVSGLLSAVSSSSATLQKMGEQVSATFGTLQGLDAKGELEKAFSQSSSCKQLTGS